MSKVKIALRFDTEDYLTKESNHALQLLCNLLDDLGVTATFPLVGEKINFLLREKRQDILRLLQKHCLGYHSWDHSRHPTIAELLEHADWQTGKLQFEESQTEGIELFRNVFDKDPCCYTQPGGNWVPHAFPALRKWRIPMHYSEDWNSYLNFGNKPYSFQGVLTWSAAVSAPKPLLNQLPQLEATSKTIIAKQHQELQEAGGGMMQIVAHPSELVTLEYWDVVNFGGGLNRPRTMPRMRTTQQVEQSLLSLERIIRYTMNLPGGVEFITARDIVDVSPCDPVAGIEITDDQLLAVVARIVETQEINFVEIGPQGYLSPAEIFSLFTKKALSLLSGKHEAYIVEYLEGPSTGPVTGLTKLVQTSFKTFLQALTTAARFVEKGSVPPGLEMEGFVVMPEEFLGALAIFIFDFTKAGRNPEMISLQPVEFVPRQFLKNVEQLHWDWPIFAPGFEPYSIYEATARQLWTFKPAPF